MGTFPLLDGSKGPDDAEGVTGNPGMQIAVDIETGPRVPVRSERGTIPDEVAEH